MLVAVTFLDGGKTPESIIFGTLYAYYVVRRRVPGTTSTGKRYLLMTIIMTQVAAFGGRE